MSTELIPSESSDHMTGSSVLPIGFHYMPANLYHAFDAVSQSGLKEFAKSPEHYRHRKLNPLEPTEAMRFGSMVHTAVLEPHLFNSLYVVVPDSLTEGITTKDGKPASSPKATSEYKTRLAEFAKKHAGAEFVDADDMRRCNGIAERLREHRDAGLLIAEATDTEVTGIWQDEETGLLCKMRVDAHCPELDTIFDVKTTSNATPAEFERTIFNFKYYWQAAMYLDGMAALGRPVSNYLIIAVETEAPYGAYTYNLKPEIIDLACKEIRPLMRYLASCKKQDVWPGYPTGVVDIGIPAWAEKRIEKDIL